MKTRKEYSDITYIVGTSFGSPVTNTLTVKEQKEIEKSGMSVEEYIEFDISSYRDWQCDC